MELARSDTDLSGVDDSALYGCGLDDYPVTTVTLEAMARHIRWQTFTFSGDIDSEALATTAAIARRKLRLA